MKRILCSLLVATLPFGSVLAESPKEKNAKVTLVYQHELRWQASALRAHIQLKTQSPRNTLLRS